MGEYSIGNPRHRATIIRITMTKMSVQNTTATAHLQGAKESRKHFWVGNIHKMYANFVEYMFKRSLNAKAISQNNSEVDT